MRWKPIWMMTAAAVSGLALVAAGCGGGGSKSSATPETTTTTETTTTESTPTTTETTTQTTTQSTTPAFAASGKCKDLAEKAQGFTQATSGANPDLQQAADAFQDFVKEVPSEIQDDVQTLADAFSKYADALKGVDLQSGQTPSADQLAKLQQLAKDFDAPKIQQASKNVQAWVTKNCSS